MCSDFHSVSVQKVSEKSEGDCADLSRHLFKYEGERAKKSKNAGLTVVVLVRRE